MFVLPHAQDFQVLFPHHQQTIQPIFWDMLPPAGTHFFLTSNTLLHFQPVGLPNHAQPQHDLSTADSIWSIVELVGQY
jgi:hypothetical protein